MSIAEKLQTIAENEQKVYNTAYDIGHIQGHENGYAMGLKEGLEVGNMQGKEAEYNAFWDTFLPENLTAENSAYLFSGKGWNNTTFNPNKDLIVPNGAQRYFHVTGELDLKAKLEERGLKFDFSKCANITYLAYSTSITRFPELDCRNIKSLNFFLQNNTKLVSIDKVILNESGNQTFASTSFGMNTKLEQVEFEGVIGNDLSFCDCPLNFESLVSVVIALSETTTGKTLTLKKSAVDKAFESSEGANDGSENYRWVNLVDERPNWTVSLV